MASRGQELFQMGVLRVPLPIVQAMRGVRRPGEGGETTIARCKRTTHASTMPTTAWNIGIHVAAAYDVRGLSTKIALRELTAPRTGSKHGLVPSAKQLRCA